MRRHVVRSITSIFAAIALTLSSPTVANADSRAINFEFPTYHPGSIDGQDGWAGTLGSPINPAIDQAVVTNTYGYSSFGGQSWRISNAYTDGAFGDWPFSPSLVNEAGETAAQNGVVYSGGTRQNHFEVQWDFASTVPTTEQMGTDPLTGLDPLQVSTAPDRGDGARMSFIKMRDTSTGLAIDFADYQDQKPYGSESNPSAGCGPEDGFVTTTVAKNLDRTRPHTVKLTIDFIDGPRNDVVNVYVDGKFRHTGGTWEDYYRWCHESGGGTGNPAFDQSRTVDSMIFQARSGGGTCGTCRGFGFLIDNLSYVSSQSECHNGDGDADFEDQDGHKHHGHFHGNSCETQDNDESDDDDQGRHFESTSVDSSTFASDSSSETLTMVGTGLDGGLPVAFTLVVIDYGGAAPAVYNLVLSDGRTIVATLVSGTVSVK